MAITTNLLNFLGFQSAVPSTESVVRQIEGVDEEFDALRGEALALAKQRAEARGNQATLLHYMYALNHLAEQRGMQLDPRAMGNLNGLAIENIVIEQKPSNPLAIEASNRSVMEDMMDLDGNGRIDIEAIGEFYDNVSFDNAHFNHVTFRPATSYNAYNTLQNARVENCTFDTLGVVDGVQQTVTLHNATNVTFQNITGGHINIDGTVQRLNISGVNASLHLSDGARVVGLIADEAHIVRFTAEPGASINGARFDGATISMASRLEGTTWRDVRFDNANLTDVDFKSAHLNNVTFSNCALSRTGFEGAYVSHVQFNNIDQMGQVNFRGAHLTHVAFNNCDPRELHQALQSAQLGEGITADGQQINATYLSNLRAQLQISGIGQTLLQAERTVEAVRSGELQQGPIDYNAPEFRAMRAARAAKAAEYAQSVLPPLAGHKND